MKQQFTNLKTVLGANPVTDEFSGKIIEVNYMYNIRKKLFITLINFEFNVYL